MENKEELEGKQRTKGREGRRLRTQREMKRVRILCLGTTRMEGNRWRDEWINLCPPEHYSPRPGMAGKTSWLEVSQHQVVQHSLSASTNETCLKRVLTPSSTELLMPWQPFPREDSPAPLGNLFLFSLTVVSNRADSKIRWKYERSIFLHCRINYPKVTPKSAEQLNHSSPKQTKVHTDFSWLYLVRPKKRYAQVWKQIYNIKNIVTTLWGVTPSHSGSFQSPTVTRGERSPGSAAGIQTLLCFSCCTTNQLRQTVWFRHWQSLLLHWHRANLLLVAVGSFKKGQTRDYHWEITGFCLCAQSLARGHPHSRSWTGLGLAGVARGSPSSPTLSDSTCLAALLRYIEAILLPVCLSWHHRHSNSKRSPHKVWSRPLIVTRSPIYNWPT